MKTKETSVCRECGTIGKPSKAMLNELVSFDDFGNDAGKRGTTQSRVGKAQLVNCTKCPNCGHSWIPEKSNKKQFKEFNPELFKAYIDKFDDKAIRDIFRIVSEKMQEQIVGYIFIDNEYVPAVSDINAFYPLKSFGISNELKPSAIFKPFPEGKTLKDMVENPFEFNEWLDNNP